MILRRVIEHVRTQNWLAVGIDFLIVVVGVFIGTQVSNWNDQRISDEEEEAFLREIRLEVSRNLETIERQVAFVDRLLEGGRNALVWLESEEDCGPDCAALVVDLFHASQIWGTSYFDVKFQEMERRGLPRDDATKQAITSFYSFVDGWDAVNRDPTAFREELRGQLTPAQFGLLWSDCYEIIEGNYEVLRMDCADDLDAEEAARTLARIRTTPELTKHLRYWIGQNIYAELFYPDMTRRAREAIAAIDRQLGEGR